MIKEMPFEAGMKVAIYKDAENQADFMGYATLKQKKEVGLPFIVSDGQTEKQQLTYVLEKWFVEWDLVDYKMVSKIPWAFEESRTQNIRALHRTGI